MDVEVGELWPNLTGLEGTAEVDGLDSTRTELIDSSNFALEEMSSIFITDRQENILCNMRFTNRIKGYLLIKTVYRQFLSVSFLVNDSRYNYKFPNSQQNYF